MRNRIVWSVIGVVLVGAGLGTWYFRGTRQRPVVQFDTVKVERGALTARVTATGTLSALVTVQIGTQVSGRLAEIFVDFNSPVKKGQLIAKIDARLFQAAVEQAQANSLAARSNLDKTRTQAADAVRQLERTRTLAQKNLVAQAELDTAQANSDAARASVHSAEATVEQARASLHQARINLDYTSILSPINGVVISRNVDVGQTVAASLQAPVLFVLAEDLKKMQVDTNVAESDVGKLQPGMMATFTVDAFPSDRFRGVIRQIRNAPQNVQSVVTYDAVIDVANPELKLKPGMTANVNVVYAERSDALKIPNAALRFRPTPAMLEQRPGRRPNKTSPAIGGSGASQPAAHARTPDQRTVWVLRGDKPDPVMVRTGVTDGSATEIVEGELHEGDPVITDVVGVPNGSSKPPGGKRLF